MTKKIIWLDYDAVTGAAAAVPGAVAEPRDVANALYGARRWRAPRCRLRDAVCVSVYVY